MKIKILLAILFTCTLSIGLAQQSSTRDTLKNDIGFNTTFILNGILNTEPTPITLMYKRYTKDYQAFRIGLSTRTNLAKTKASINDSISSNKNSLFHLSLSLGKEFQRELNKNWIWYFGADLVPSYSFSKDFKSGLSLNGTNKRKTETYSLSAKPFMAIRFNIHKRLYLSAEASLSVGYTKISQAYTNSTFNPDTDASSFYIALSPAAGLFLFHRF